jgi:nucleoside-diphosphate-sugar epimerase
MNGEEAICPVSPDLVLWLSSPDTIVRNLIHASTLNNFREGDWRTINLPGISVSVRQMLESLKRVTGDSTVKKVFFKPDANINRIVSSWPGTLANRRALSLGFHADKHFDEFIRQHITEKETHQGV